MAIGINVEVDRQTDIYIEREIFLRKVYSPETTSEAYTTTTTKKNSARSPKEQWAKEFLLESQHLSHLSREVPPQPRAQGFPRDGPERLQDLP